MEVVVVNVKKYIPWEPNTFIFRGYNPYIGGLKPSFFMVLGSKGTAYILKLVKYIGNSLAYM